MSINRCEERISHFQCGYCQQWWSIADAPLEKTTWYCPSCGKRDAYEVMETDDVHVVAKS